MRDEAPPDGDQNETALRALFQAIASRDGSLTTRLLAGSPLLARQAIRVGATRATAGAHYFEEIPHYVYAGDTPLHLAVQNTGRGGSALAAAREEQREIIRLLLSGGARPSDLDSAGRPVRDCVKAGWIQAELRRPR